MSSSITIQGDTQIAGTIDAVFLGTDSLSDNIKHRAVSAGFVTIGAQGAKFALNFVAAAVLARVLNPRDFGLVGMVLAITGLGALFNELGLSTATVQQEKITQHQVSNLFWVNVSVSGMLTGIAFISAPLVAKFYRDPRVTGIMMVLSLTFLLTGSTVQHQALLTRQLRFRAIAIIEVTSILLGFVAACCLAGSGFGYWALVIQQLVIAAITLMLTWYISRWRPSLPKWHCGTRPMLRFGAHLAASDFIVLSLTNSDSILVGRFFGAAPLGLYTRASVLLRRPLEQIAVPINSVLIPVLSRLQSDPEGYRRTFMRTYDTLALLFFSFAAICLALAKPLVLVILGSKWSGAIPLLSAFALVAVGSPLLRTGVWNFQSQGRGKDQLHSHGICGAVNLGSYLIGLHWGVLGIIISLAITTLVIRLPVVYYLSGRSGPVTTRDLWTSFLLHLPCWGTVYFATAMVYAILKNTAPIIQLLVCTPIGLGVGIALLLPFRRPRQSARYAWNTLTTSLVRRRTPA